MASSPPNSTLLLGLLYSVYVVEGMVVGLPETIARPRTIAATTEPWRAKTVNSGLLDTPMTPKTHNNQLNDKPLIPAIPRIPQELYFGGVLELEGCYLL